MYSTTRVFTSRCPATTIVLMNFMMLIQLLWVAFLSEILQHTIDSRGMQGIESHKWQCQLTHDVN